MRGQTDGGRRDNPPVEHVLETEQRFKPPPKYAFTIYQLVRWIQDMFVSKNVPTRAVTCAMEADLSSLGGKR